MVQANHCCTSGKRHSGEHCHSVLHVAMPGSTCNLLYNSHGPGRIQWQARPARLKARYLHDVHTCWCGSTAYSNIPSRVVALGALTVMIAKSLQSAHACNCPYSGCTYICMALLIVCSKAAPKNDVLLLCRWLSSASHSSSVWCWALLLLCWKLGQFGSMTDVVQNVQQPVVVQLCDDLWYISSLKPSLALFLPAMHAGICNSQALISHDHFICTN